MSIANVANFAGPLIGGAISSSSANKSNKRAIAFQDEVNKHSIYWRTKDAKRSGLHPLAALGVSPGNGAPPFMASDMGQDVSRAIKALGSAADRGSSEMKELAMERARLENDLIRAQTTKVNRSTNPPMPQPNSKHTTAVSGDHDAVNIIPHEITSPRSSNRGMTSGVPPAAMEIRNRDGSTSVVPSQDVSEALEAGGEIVGGIMSADWFMRNRAAPWIERQYKNYKKGSTYLNPFVKTPYRYKRR